MPDPLEPRCRLVLVRHGQTPCTVDGLFCGSHDAALSSVGERMTEALARHPALAGVELLLTSPALRARQTARAISRASGLDPQVDDRLRELSFGAWENLRPAEVPDPAAHRRWVRDPAYFAPPGGETGLQVQARVLDLVRDATAGRSAVAVVTHKAPIRLIVAFFLGMPASRYRDIGVVSVGSVTELTIGAGRGDVRVLGDVTHLPQPWRRDPDRAADVLAAAG
ncbi:histidine phosphatase family protein [Actinoplanes teichomyceticus]|uniref:Putative phosphoglycerate mutase n=1 Tax=Actinoplanes teichomyceticus TaxID=1867 RepID=A0A561VIM1_ACTTI|nr:histidine phosphatase family protein [Actinoplanes teichomyceticus]TWG11468.1 putative phosphoglycerate mutase [Actinoplanes teichomyceticus]GIF15718.1 hypothetical protein Ate01nite_57500 [Actinoplanes teichomyceticus]